MIRIPPPPPGSDFKSHEWQHWFFVLASTLSSALSTLDSIDHGPAPAFITDEGGGGDGEMGPPGVPGVAGAAGATGPAGPMGFGMDGLDGDDGQPIPGARGATGPAGSNGFGLDGEDGQDGMSLVGPQGTAGSTGSQGPMGPAIFLVAEDGEDGMIGTPGKAGAAGADGATGTATRNAIINGGMQVGQRGALTLGSSSPAGNAGYGKVDRWQAWATGTAVSAGTADQMTTANCGRTGYALKLAGVTLTGTGIVYIRHRIEGINALRFKNQTATFSIKVKHDVGSSINYTVTVRKPTALDNYASTTVIQTGSATAVATGTETTLTLASVSMGDCSYGIEIEIKAECGAITTKNFWYAEAQLEEGASATTFEYISYEQELVRCLRYCEATLGSIYNQVPAYAYSGNEAYTYAFFRVQKRIVPTITCPDGFNDCWFTAGKNATGSSFGPSTTGMWIGSSGAGWGLTQLTAGFMYLEYTTYASAEL